MGLLSGITGIFTAGEQRRRQEQINTGRRNLARIQNAQAERAEIAQFRQAQAESVLQGFAFGQQGASSASSANLQSVTSQARTISTERQQQRRIDDSIAYAQGRLGRINEIRDLAQGADAIVDFFRGGGFAGGLTGDKETNIFTG